MTRPGIEPRSPGPLANTLLYVKQLLAEVIEGIIIYFRNRFKQVNMSFPY